MGLSVPISGVPYATQMAAKGTEAAGVYTPPAGPDYLGMSLGALAAAPKIYQGILGYKYGRKQDRYQKRGLQASVRGAERAYDQGGEDMHIARRRLEESLASRGIADSSIADQNLARQGRTHARMHGNLTDQRDMAHRAYKTWREGARKRKFDRAMGVASPVLQAGGVLLGGL